MQILVLARVARPTVDTEIVKLLVITLTLVIRNSNQGTV